MWNLFIAVPQMRLDQIQYVRAMREMFIQASKGVTSVIASSPSLYHYYELLPKWCRDHPAIKTIVRGLEYHHPLVDFQKKVFMVNLACSLLLPRDDILNTLAEQLYDAVPEPITSKNIGDLVKYDSRKERKIELLDDDYYTEDDVYERGPTTSAMVRQWEKEEEDEKKAKKEEEARLKREAEEMKAQGKAPLSKEKIDEIEAQKMEDVMESERAEERARERREKRLEKEDKKMRIVEEYRLKRSGVENKKEEIVKLHVPEFFDKTRKNISRSKQQSSAKSENDDDMMMSQSGNLDDGELAEDKEDELKQVQQKEKKDKMNKKKMAQRSLSEKQMDRQIRERNEKIYKIISQNKTKSFEETVEGIIKQFCDNTEEKKDVLVALMKTDIISMDQKNELVKIFNFDNSIEEIERELEESRKDRIKQIDLMKELIEVNSTGVSTEDLVTFEDLYKASLKDEDIKIEETESQGLTDVYIHPRMGIDEILRAHDPYIPLEYYMNDDGFWDDYINAKKAQVDIKLYTFKPFHTIKSRMKKKEE